MIYLKLIINFLKMDVSFCSTFSGKDVKKTFRNLIDSLKHTIRKGTSYYRARIGYKEKTEEIGISKTKIKIPLPSKELFAPPILKN